MPEIQDPPYKVNPQVLADFSATVQAKPNLTKEELFSKFPEFNNDEKFLQTALDYSSTSLSGKYKTVEELNSKFPEFDFNLEKKNGVGSNGALKSSNGIDVKAEAAKFEKERASIVPENHFAAIENVLVEKRNADSQWKDAQKSPSAMSPGAMPTSQTIEFERKYLEQSGIVKKQAEQSQDAVLKANDEKILQPIKELVKKPTELKKFFKGDEFDYEYAINHFDKYVKERGGGNYSRDMMVNKMKQAAEWEHDKPQREKLLTEEFKKQGVDVGKYGTKLYEQSVAPKINSLKEMQFDAKAKADKYIEDLQPVADQVGGEYKQAIADIQLRYNTKALTAEQANAELSKANNDYVKKVKGLDDQYNNQIKNINKSVADKYGRITKEIEAIGKGISDEEVWASIPEADKKKISLAQEAAQKRLEAEKQQTKKDIDKVFYDQSPLLFAGKALGSGWFQGVADFGDYLSFKGFDNSFVRKQQMQRTAANELAPAEYTWQKNPFMRAITSSATSLGASIPVTGPALGVTLLSGGLGLPALVTTVAGGLTAFYGETAQNTGGTYSDILQQTGGDVAQAISSSTTFSERQDKLIPLYFIGSLGLQNLLKGGLGKKILGGGLELLEEEPTEYYQGYTQAQALPKGAAFEGSFGEYIKENPELFLDVAAGTFGQAATMAAAGKAYRTLFTKAPNAEEQFYADMIEKGGVEVAIKNAQQLVENDIISEDEYKIKYAKIQSVLATLGKVEQLGITGDDAAAFFSYSINVNDLTRKVANEKNEGLKDIYNQKLKEAKNDLTEIAQGKGVYAVVTMPGGGNQTFVMPVEEIDDEVIQYAEKIEVKNDKLANKDIQNRKSKLGFPDDVPDGMYQVEKLTAAEEKIKAGDMLGALTTEEKKEWNDLSMTEKLELAKENLPETEGRSNVELMEQADARAKELLAKLHGEPEQATEFLSRKLTYEQKYTDVEFVDPISNETKTMSAESARGQMKKRYEALDALIKCLT